MNKLSGFAAVAGASLFGVFAVLGAVHFRDSAEVPHWQAPSASLAMPVMAQLAQPEPARAPMPRPPPPPVAIAPTPTPVAAPTAPPPPAARVVAEAIANSPPAPPAAAPAAPPPDLEDLDDDALSQAQRVQIQAAQVGRLQNLDLARNRRMMRGPRPMQRGPR